tara:strand:+ start:2904 stop:4424 length:1521 start_codon:yes stop_codon:yes gene_type:complete
MVIVTLIAILIIGGVIALLSEKFSEDAPRVAALIAILVALFYFVFQLGNSDYASLTTQSSLSDPTSWLIHLKLSWIPAFGISIEFALDGLSLLMVALTLILGAVAVSASWTDIKKHQGFFEANVLWTLAGVIGVFTALDLFLFFLFWEVMLIPMYFIIAIWGHENRGYAAMKFFIFTQASGLLMLVSAVALAIIYKEANGHYSFSYFDLTNLPMGYVTEKLLMVGFFVAFVVKLPGFPFHTWLPDAHTQAPTAGSVILAGILLKTGAYGLIRFAVPLFPTAANDFAPIAMALGVFGIIYGAMAAFAQTDFKRLVAYSSVSHMGFILLGVYAWNELALQGVVIQIIAHGFSSAALFMIAGSLQERLHTRDMREMSGLWKFMPKMGASAMFFIIASLGLPGLGNFIGEVLILLGLYQAASWMAVAAALGLITGAIYSLILMQKSFYGEPNAHWGKTTVLHDFKKREMLTMYIMMGALVALGIYPQPIMDVAQATLIGLLEAVQLGLVI